MFLVERILVPTSEVATVAVSSYQDLSGGCGSDRPLALEVRSQLSELLSERGDGSSEGSVYQLTYLDPPCVEVVAED